MSVMKGFRNLKHKAEQLFQSLDKVAGGRAAALTTIKLPSDLALANLAIASIDAENKILEITGHSLRDDDDVIKVKTGLAVDIEIFIEEIIDVNNVRVVEIPTGLAPTDEVMPMRYSSLKMAPSGDLIVSQGPIQFTLDGAPQEVIEDTGNSANNRPLPVKLTGVTGDINITANDLNVQLSHIGVNADSTQVGDGVEIWQINASGEGTVKDSDAEVAIQAVRDRLPVNLGRQAAVDSLATVLSNEDKAVLDSIDGKDFATETTLAAILADTGSLDGKDFSTETTLVGMSAKLPTTIGQKSRALSLGVTLSQEDQITQEAMATDLGLIEAKDFATETTLAAQAANIALIEGKDFATQTTLAAQAADIALLEAKDFATQTTLTSVLGDTTSMDGTLASIFGDTTSIDGKLPVLGRAGEDFSIATVLSTEDKAALDAINTNLNGVIGAITNKEVHQSTFNSSASLDTGTYLAIGTAIPFGVTIREIEIKYEDGTPIEVFDASAGTSLGIIAQGEGKIPVEIVGDNAKQIHLRALGANFVAPNLIVNAIKGN